MINIDLGETYGLGSFEEAMAAIEVLRKRSFSDDEINAILERSKDNGGSAALKDTPLPSGVLIPGKVIPDACCMCFCFHESRVTGQVYCLACPDPVLLRDPETDTPRVIACPLIEVKEGTAL